MSNIRTLSAIQAFIDRNGYPPTRRELADELGLLSKSSAQQAVDRLEQAGLIEVDRKSSRSMRITSVGMVALTEEMNG